MEIRGSIHSIRQLEKMIIQSMPHNLVQDGHFQPDGFDPDKSASKVPALSQVYTRKYKMFPFGKERLWEERARVKFHFDERHGIGTMTISDRGMHIMGIEIQAQFSAVKVKDKVRELQLGNGIEVIPGKDV